MTEFWKSNPMHWCDYCKVWMQDNPAARATHEKGVKHKDNVARKLRQMRSSADKAVKDQELAETSMVNIEARAQQQYEQDLQEASKARSAASGAWVLDGGSAYHYNEHHQFYYDRSTQMYYGGDPPAWTLNPLLPAEALFESSAPAPPPDSDAGAHPHKPPRPRAFSKKLHPASEIGGYQMPIIGAVGGAKKLSEGQPSNSRGTKRKGADQGQLIDGKQNKSLEEAAAIAKRKAAQARVQSRTMQAFGLA